MQDIDGFISFCFSIFIKKIHKSTGTTTWVVIAPGSSTNIIGESRVWYCRSM